MYLAQKQLAGSLSLGVSATPCDNSLEAGRLGSTCSERSCNSFHVRQIDAPTLHQLPQHCRTPPVWMVQPQQGRCNYQLMLRLTRNRRATNGSSRLGLSRGSTKARSVRKPRHAQQTLLDVSSGHSQSTAAVAAAPHSAPVSAKRSLSSALGSSSSGGSAPKRAKSSVGLAATDELERSQAKAASLQLRCNRLEQELHSAQLRTSVAEAAQQQIAQARQTLSASDQSRRRVPQQLDF